MAGGWVAEIGKHRNDQLFSEVPMAVTLVKIWSELAVLALTVSGGQPGPVI